MPPAPSARLGCGFASFSGGADNEIRNQCRGPAGGLESVRTAEANGKDTNKPLPTGPGLRRTSRGEKKAVRLMRRSEADGRNIGNDAKKQRTPQYPTANPSSLNAPTLNSGETDQLGSPLLKCDLHGTRSLIFRAYPVQFLDGPLVRGATARLKAAA
ncbi:hypothetical protein SKAU_G00140990 [Synaphobranchus kaupii]|uniref:Uncharacterized protein n=1 Tax=Synaphobranchus kaupii TaxID=118154 RepID=A0A9Q1J493_SYNKA|nr:hypothetical protein SKAU_G00140990 [Synaphobranchus kaupii]